MALLLLSFLIAVSFAAVGEREREEKQFIALLLLLLSLYRPPGRERGRKRDSTCRFFLLLPLSRRLSVFSSFRNRQERLWVSLCLPSSFFPSLSLPRRSGKEGFLLISELLKEKGGKERKKGSRFLLCEHTTE